MFGLTVELRRHIGKKRTRGGDVVEVEHDQFIVLCHRDGMTIECGILPHRTGAPLLWIPDSREAVGPLFQEEIERLAQAEKLRMMQPA